MCILFFLMLQNIHHLLNYVDIQRLKTCTVIMLRTFLIFRLNYMYLETHLYLSLLTCMLLYINIRLQIINLQHFPIEIQ